MAPPSQGLSLARQIGMMTYRSPEDYETKFSRDIRKITKYPVIESTDYKVKNDKRFDALSITITLMDTHDIQESWKF